MNLLDTIRENIKSDSHIELAVVFGSAAKSNLNETSDIDLGIRMAPNVTDDKLQQLELDLGRLTGRSIDIVLIDQAPPLLRFEIAKDGIVLRQDDDYQWADFCAKAMIDWWDWAPVAKKINQTIIAGLRKDRQDGEK
jgi:predicted nucleotidyltransferase